MGVIVSMSAVKTGAVGVVVVLAEVSAITADVVPSGVGYDLLLGATVLSILGLVGWATRYLLVEIIKPATDAHIKALGVLQVTTEDNRTALNASATALSRLTVVVDEAVERGRKAIEQSEIDSRRLQSVEIAIMKVVDGLERAANGSDPHIGQTRREVRQLIGDHGGHDGGKKQ